MELQYAKSQPEGFRNCVERVAIVGAGGMLGQSMVKALLETGKHTVTALTRVGSKSVLPSGVRIAPVSYDDDASLIKALTGQQFLIMIIAFDAPPETHTKLAHAAGKAGVPYVMPSIYTADIVLNNRSVGEEVMVPQLLLPRIQEIERNGVSSWVVLVTSHWYEFSLAAPPDWFGFDLKARKVIFFDDGKAKINTTTVPQCGRAVAALLSLKELPDDENDQSPTLSMFRNKPLYVSSFKISQSDMLDSVYRVTKTTSVDWDITYESAAERVQRGMEDFKNGKLLGIGKAMYSRLFFPEGDWWYDDKLHNHLLGLPEEDLDGATSRAVLMADSGWIPH